MVNISAERINTVSPYYVVSSKHDGEIRFTTDYGVRYTVGFELTDLLICAETYQFYITNTNNTKSPRDSKLRSTILSIVADFFEHNNLAMLYICDTGDNKQSMRSRLFNFWASTFPQHERFSITSERVKDEEGNENYATLIIRKDNPKAEFAIKEFQESITALNHKPNI